MNIDSRICTQCKEKNAPSFTVCWKCGSSMKNSWIYSKEANKKVEEAILSMINEVEEIYKNNVKECGGVLSQKGLLRARIFGANFPIQAYNVVFQFKNWQACKDVMTSFFKNVYKGISLTPEETTKISGLLTDDLNLALINEYEKPGSGIKDFENIYQAALEESTGALDNLRGNFKQKLPDIVKNIVDRGLNHFQILRDKLSEVLISSNQIHSAEEALDNKYRPIELHLVKAHKMVFDIASWNETELDEMLYGMLDLAIKKSKESGLYDKKIDAQQLLNLVKTNGKAREDFSYDLKVQDGVNDNDFIWWWSLDDVERQMTVVVDDWFRYAEYLNGTNEGKSPEDAAHQVKKSYAIYGNLKDESHSSGDDRPLPYELKDRVNTWLINNGLELATIKKEEINKSTSMNAFIRKELRAGNI